AQAQGGIPATPAALGSTLSADGFAPNQAALAGEPPAGTWPVPPLPADPALAARVVLDAARALQALPAGTPGDGDTTATPGDAATAIATALAGQAAESSGPAIRPDQGGATAAVAPSAGENAAPAAPAPNAGIQGALSTSMEDATAGVQAAVQTALASGERVSNTGETRQATNAAVGGSSGVSIADAAAAPTPAVERAAGGSDRRSEGETPSGQSGSEGAGRSGVPPATSGAPITNEPSPAFPAPVAEETVSSATGNPAALAQPVGAVREPAGPVAAFAPEAVPGGGPAVDLPNQITPAVIRQARLLTVDGAHEMTLRLDPERLGPLHVRLSLRDGALSVGLAVANAETRRALEASLSQLRATFADAGLRLERLDLSEGSNPRDPGAGTPDGGQGGAFGTFGNPSGDRGQNGTRSGASGPEIAQFGSPDGRSEDTPTFAGLLLDEAERALETRLGRPSPADRSPSPPREAQGSPPTRRTASPLPVSEGVRSSIRSAYAAYRDNAAPRPASLTGQ
ncbi:MAG: flagellar hook-length control protein FliK, partial [Chloroflexota bacterium]